jgi:hypothetical protein
MVVNNISNLNKTNYSSKKYPTTKHKNENYQWKPVVDIIYKLSVSVMLERMLWNFSSFFMICFNAHSTWNGVSTFSSKTNSLLTITILRR